MEVLIVEVDLFAFISRQLIYLPETMMISYSNKRLFICRSCCALDSYGYLLRFTVSLKNNFKALMRCAKDIAEDCAPWFIGRTVLTSRTSRVCQFQKNSPFALPKSTSLPFNVITPPFNSISTCSLLVSPCQLSTRFVVWTSTPCKLQNMLCECHLNLGIDPQQFSHLGTPGAVGVTFHHSPPWRQTEQMI